MSVNRDRQIALNKANRGTTPLERMVRREDSVSRAPEPDPDEMEEQLKKEREARAKKRPKPKPRAKPKGIRNAKVKRMLALWGVFNVAHQLVASFGYSKKAEAEAHAEKLMVDKNTLHFVQPIKAPVE